MISPMKGPFHFTCTGSAAVELTFQVSKWTQILGVSPVPRLLLDDHANSTQNQSHHYRQQIMMRVFMAFSVLVTPLRRQMRV